MIQKEDPNLIPETDDIQANYGLLQTFWRTAEGRSHAANLDSRFQYKMNKWKKIEQAKGIMHPRLNMVDHYSHAWDFMYAT
jgi:hypothetical protein